MPVTYESIMSETVSSPTSLISLNSIPSTYTDLIIVCDGAMTANANKFIQFNSDTSNLYSCTFLVGQGTTPVSARYTSAAYLDVVGPVANRNMNVTHIFNYAGNTFKSYLTRNSTGQFSAEYGVGLYRSTTAISSIQIKSTPNNFATGFTVSLYGIKAA